MGCSLGAKRGADDSGINGDGGMEDCGMGCSGGADMCYSSDDLDACTQAPRLQVWAVGTQTHSSGETRVFFEGLCACGMGGASMGGECGKGTLAWDGLRWMACVATLSQTWAPAAFPPTHSWGHGRHENERGGHCGHGHCAN